MRMVRPKDEAEIFRGVELITFPTRARQYRSRTSEKDGPKDGILRSRWNSGMRTHADVKFGPNSGLVSAACHS